MLQIGLLGTLQVVHEGVHVTPSAPKVRQVLALLALRANATVPLHQLVEELWEEHPPSSAATTLQTYIYQLRKLPGLCDQHRPGPAEDGGAALRTTPAAIAWPSPPTAWTHSGSANWPREEESSWRRGRRRRPRI